MSQTVADVLVGVLEQIGVKHIFALLLTSEISHAGSMEPTVS